MISSLPQQVYAQLRPRLLAGEFAPGDRLKYVRLAAELGVSTTPVREAMTLLAGEGLVRLLPGTGAIVHLPEPIEPSHSAQDELGLVYGVREAFETHAAGVAAGRISPAETQQLARLQREMRTHGASFQAASSNDDATAAFRQFADSDAAFHLTIITATGNPRLVAIAQEAASHVRRLEDADQSRLPQKLISILAAHDEILAALLKREAQQARELMRRHLRSEG